MSEVGTSITPSPAPSVRTNPWTSIVAPVRHYPDCWFLADRKSTPIAGNLGIWLVTDVYRYKYALSP
jgi:hypothetical protein